MWTKVQKSKVSPTPHTGPGGTCRSGASQPAEQCLGDSLARPPSATQGVFAVVNGTAEFLQHDFQGRVLGKLDHEHAGLHADVARVGGTYQRNTGPALEGWLAPAWGAGEDSGGERADTQRTAQAANLTCEGTWLQTVLFDQQRGFVSIFKLLLFCI